MINMKSLSALGRIFLGIAYLIYGYLHFSHTHADTNLIPENMGHKTFWVIFVGICWWAAALSFFTNILTKLSGTLAAVLLLLVFFIVVLPHFSGMASILSTASIFGMIGGSLLVSSKGKMMPEHGKKE